MKPISKRLFSLLLAVVLVLGLPSQAMAATNVGGNETTATQPTDATEPVSTEASDPTEPAETLETTEPAATEETESEPTDTPTTPDVTEPEATETPTEPTEPREPTEPLTPEEQDMIRWAELEAQLPDPIEEYFPFAPEIKYPYGEPQDNFYPSSLFEADPYALMPLADMSAIPDNMYDNSILRALAYTGYDVQWLKDNGFLYVAEYVSSNINNYRPEVLSDIGYDDYAPFLNGDETVADASTVTGRAPDIASFESSGLVCASFVSYYINNYLPNIEGYDTSHIHEAIKATTATSTGYSTASVWSWETGLTNLANTPGSGVTKYTNETEGYANLVPGDIIVFSRDGELVHVAIYAGTYSMWNIRGTNRGEKHFIIHVGNSRGPEISTTEYLAKSGTAKSSVATAWYHLELGSVVDQVGFIEVYKKDPNGNNLSGARFKAVDQDTGDTFYIGPTDANGYAKSGEMPLGTYVVTETVFPDGYQASGQTSWTMTLTEDTPNMTVTINAVNEPVTGSAKIVKATTNGGSKAGWHFEVKNSSGTVIGTYVTDSTGIITLNLEPDTYTVTELNTPADYWINDPIPTKTLTVRAGETSIVSFRNQHIGKAKIVKVLENPEHGTVAGWTFELKLPSGMSIGEHTTDASGTILLDMEPGTYTVTEILDEDSAWQCVSDITQTVVVEPGQTAEIIFVNALKSTEMIVQKVNTLGEPLGNAEFLLEWSENGSKWEPVIAADVGRAVKGSCTAVGLLDGKLITGEDGTTHFTGLNPDLQYRLTETKAPTGYQLLPQTAFEGTISMDDNQVFTVTVVNAPEYVLPMTGSKSPVMMAISLLICVAGCIGALKYFRRKDK